MIPSLPWLLVAVAREHLYLKPQVEIVRPLRISPTPAWLARFRGRDWILAEAGVGSGNVVRTLDWLQTQSTCSGAIFAGFAGALREQLKVGDIVVADAVVGVSATSRERFLPTLPMSPTGAVRGTLFTSDHLIGSPADKLRIGDEQGAIAVDMESAAFARWCQAAGVPWACVRVISDDARTEVSSSVFDLVEEGQVRMGRVLAAVARRPALMGELWRLGRATRLAARELARILLDSAFAPHRP